MSLQFLLFVLDLTTDVKLQKALNLNDSSVEFGLQHFTYNNSILLENIFQHLSETNFNGIVVSVD